MSNVMTVKDLRAKTSSDRQKLLVSLHKQVRELLFERQAGSLTKVRKIRQARKSIAKILTIENEKS